jgi:hypothetical protein
VFEKVKSSLLVQKIEKEEDDRWQSLNREDITVLLASSSDGPKSDATSRH